MLNIENTACFTKWKDGLILNSHVPCGSASHKLRLDTLFGLPFNVFILNENIEILKANKSALDTCGFVSEKDAIGRTIRAVAKKKTAEEIINLYKNFLDSGANQINEENYWRLDNFNFSTITIKFPLYCDRNKKIGLLGFSILNGIPTNYTTSKALTLLAELNLLSFPAQSMAYPNLNEFNFTNRERNIALFLIQGKTAKSIAMELCLSVRTIENYIASMKSKLNLVSKAELVEFLIHNL